MKKEVGRDVRNDICIGPRMRTYEISCFLLRICCWETQVRVSWQAMLRRWTFLMNTWQWPREGKAILKQLRARQELLQFYAAWPSEGMPSAGCERRPPGATKTGLSRLHRDSSGIKYTRQNSRWPVLCLSIVRLNALIISVSCRKGTLLCGVHTSSFVDVA